MECRVWSLYQCVQLKTICSGDCFIACGFISYLGPFIKEMRELLLSNTFIAGCESLAIPYTKNLHLTQFLVSNSEIGQWTSQVEHLILVSHKQ